MKKKQPTIKNIATELGISFSTVSRALQNNPRISAITKAKVWEVAKRINYIPNPAAYFLKNNKTFTIGILIPTLFEQFFTDVIMGIENVIEAQGYHSVIIQSRETLEKEVKAVEAFLKMRIDGLIVSVSAQTHEYSHFKELENHGIPVVFFDRVPHQIGFNKVKCNTRYGAQMAINYLVAHNCKKIAFINGPKNLDTSIDRLEGYLTGLAINNIPKKESLIKNCDLSKSNTLLKIKEILTDNEIPDAIITFNDYVALYAIEEIKKLNLKKEILFIGFGNLPMKEYLSKPPDATVEMFPTEIGFSAAKLLIECIEEVNENIPFKEIMIETKLIEFEKN